MEFLFQVFDSKWMAWVWTKGKLKKLFHCYYFKICLECLIVLMKQTKEQSEPPKGSSALHAVLWELVTCRGICATQIVVLLFLEIYLCLLIMGVGALHTCVQLSPEAGGVRFFLELDCALVSWLLWALGTELRSSASTASPLSSFW